jgi:fumarate reductase subunit C
MATYPRRMGSDWWLKRGAYTFIMLRELTAVLIAAYLVWFVVLVEKLGQGAEAYADYVDVFLRSPAMLVFHAIALAASLFHTITWFNLAPRALVVRIGEDRLPEAAIAGPHYAAWIVFSLGVLWWVLG